MKHLSENQLLELFDPSDNQKAVAFGALRKVSSDADFADFCKAVDLGRLKLTTVVLDGSPLYTVFFQIDAFGGI
jgi:hypothetical protein